MKMLVIDYYCAPRDLAQMDMYVALYEQYEVIFANSENFADLVKAQDFDYLYLGIYHPWCGKFDWNNLLKINKKPIIIDQADNEGFIGRRDTKFEYGDNCILLSRYLPNDDLRNFWKGKLCLLPWYINPERFIPQEKTIDVAFVCSMNVNNRIDREKLGERILKYCQDNNLSYKIGEYWGQDYKNIITSSKSMVVDGSRYCLTQKYIECALSNCLIIGERPIYPPNEFITVNLESVNSNNIDDFHFEVLSNNMYALDNYANKEKFLDNFKVILEFK